MRSLRIETDCLRVRLCLDWGSTVIHLSPMGVSLHLPLTIPVPRVLVKRTMSIIHTPHSCDVCIIRENVWYPVQMLNADTV